MTKDPHADDLFQNSAMTIGEHLEELRKALFRSLMCLIVFSLVGLYFADRVVDFIKRPLETALERYYLDLSLANIRTRLSKLKTQGETVPEIDLVVQSVRQDKLFPTPVYVDPLEIQEELYRLGMAPHPGASEPSTRVREQDFTDLPRFCRAVADQAALAPPAPGKRLMELLPAPAKEALTEIAKEGKADELRTEAFLAGLNTVLERPDFYEKEAFAGAGLLVEQVDMASRIAKLADYERLRFNRWILGTAFADQPKPASRKGSMIRFLRWESIEDDARIRVKSLNTQEMFVIFLKAALLFGAVVGSPGIFYYLWEFVASGLYPHERRYVYFFLPLSIGLFVFGALLAFFFVFQFVLDFLLSFNRSMNVDPDIRITEWLGLALMLPLGFGISFQLPLVMFFLERIGLMTVEGYLKRWREAIFTIAVLAALLSPGGDPYSMLFMAVPLVGLYYLGIFLCHYWPRNRNPFGQAALDD